MRRHAEGADLSKVAGIPRWVDAMLSHDLVAYPLHVIAGLLLNRFDAPPAVAGLEWLKAAAHAKTEAARQRVARGLVVTRGRSVGGDFDTQVGAAIVRRVTRDGKDARMQRRQLQVLELAGIPAPASACLVDLRYGVSETPDRR